jgi:hypothetical protein
MQRGSSEQTKLVQHRRKLLPIICKVYGVLLFASLVALSQHGTPKMLRVFAAGILYGTFPLVLFLLWYWRCPVCKRAFSRQSGSKYCENCNTSFEP